MHKIVKDTQGQFLLAPYWEVTQQLVLKEIETKKPVLGFEPYRQTSSFSCFSFFDSILKYNDYVVCLSDLFTTLEILQNKDHHHLCILSVCWLSKPKQ